MPCTEAGLVCTSTTVLGLVLRSVLSNSVATCNDNAATTALAILVSRCYMVARWHYPVLAGRMVASWPRCISSSHRIDQTSMKQAYDSCSWSEESYFKHIGVHASLGASYLLGHHSPLSQVVNRFLLADVLTPEIVN
jgi:hypothetical protein